MKRIFDWLREQINDAYRNFQIGGSRFMYVVDAVDLINEAEAKWEKEVCEWKLEDAEANLYVTGCGKGKLVFEDMRTPTEDDYKFCPYCGKKIKEVKGWKYCITL